jgi:DNA polymerase-3 subunit epsilon
MSTISLSTKKFVNSFAAIDFETADDGRDSACSVAVVKVIDTQIVEGFHCLIRPPRRNFKFTYLHGISWQDVAHEPTFDKLWPSLVKKLNDIEFIAAHNASFDRSVLMACCKANNLILPSPNFLCTVQLARSTWGLSSATLPHVCKLLGIPLHHHKAESDAEACAKIVLAARQKNVPLIFLRPYQGRYR